MARKAIKQSNAEKDRHILIFGDSNALCSDDKVECWPTLLQEKEPDRLRIYNESCNGRTTRFDEGELNGVNAFSATIKNCSCLDYIIFMIGTNDLKKRYASSVDEAAEGMRQLIDTAMSANISAAMILLTPPPMGNVNSEEFMGRVGLLARLTAAYKKLADMHHIKLIDIYKQLDAACHLQGDRIHLNGSGRARVADLIWNDIIEG